MRTIKLLDPSDLTKHLPSRPELLLSLIGSYGDTIGRDYVGSITYKVTPVKYNDGYLIVIKEGSRVALLALFT